MGWSPGGGGVPRTGRGGAPPPIEPKPGWFMTGVRAGPGRICAASFRRLGLPWLRGTFERPAAAPRGAKFVGDEEEPGEPDYSVCSYRTTPP